MTQAAYPTTKKALLALLVPALMAYNAQAVAQDEVTEPEVALETMNVVVSGKPQEQVGEQIVTRRELTEQNIQNAQDLVRYNTEVDVAEVGRYGNKGFAIRGVDGNRVAINIDGIALPEVESNEIYSPYGYNYEGRFNPDLEMIGSVRLAAGADSLMSGSGAVGGSVSYNTKEPRDLLKHGNPIGGYAKVGYTTKNEELLTAAGLAGQYDKLEFLLNYAHRKGHELKNHDMRSHNKDRMDINYDFVGNGEWGSRYSNTSALYPDAVDYERNSALAKLYYHINDNHRLGLHGLYQKQESESLAISKGTSGRRYAIDTEKMEGYGINYRFTPNDSRFLDTLEASYARQDVEGIARTNYHSSGYDFATDSTYYYPSSITLRPTQTTTDQFKLDAKFLPIDWDKLGLHTFGLTASYSKQDYRASKIIANTDSQGNITWNAYYNSPSASQDGGIPFPDAKKDIYSIILSDNIEFNDRLNARLGVRYDRHTYKPYFQDDTWFDSHRTSEQWMLANSTSRNTAFYQNYINGKFDEHPSFGKFTYGGAFDWKIIPEKLTARYKVGTGFLAPNITQMYSAFEGMTVQQLINTDLKPETSVNHELELEWQLDPVTLTASAYRSDYKNFIHSVFWNRWDASRRNTDCQQTYCIQYQNLDEAQITGYKLGLRADLSRYLNNADRMYVTLDYHNSKDKAYITADQEQDGVLEINTLAAVPSSTILGIDYHFADDKASLHFRSKFTEAKRAEDTKYVTTVYDRTRTSGYREEVATFKHLNRLSDTTIFDLFGTYKINNHLFLNAGIYNITNKRYIPWETLRQFANAPNINQMIDCGSYSCNGYGFNRYTAPGRNYAISLTYEF